MDQLACVDVPALPLQVLLRNHPDWAGCAAAVVDKDRPQGQLLWVNERARRAGILPGFRYAAGLALSADLRAAEVSPEEIGTGVNIITAQLRRFSPSVEPCDEEPGVFWLDAGQLERVFPSLTVWAGQLRAELRKLGFYASVAVGFSRFSSYAVARALRGHTRVIETAEEEATTAARVPLARIGLQPETRDGLDRLGIRTVGDFLRLPSVGLLQRFGPEAHRLHLMASGNLPVPLQPRAAEVPLESTLDLDEEESDSAALMFLVKQLLDPLLRMLADRSALLAELTLTLSFRQAPELTETIKPAAPTLDSGRLLELVRLRIEALSLREGTKRIRVLVRGLLATRAQMHLFAEKPRRDLAAAARAFARLRAAFGNDVVVHAQLKDGHLPEATFTWKPLDQLAPAQPRMVASRSLVRRIEATPVRLLPRPPLEPDGWLIHGLAHGAVIKLQGPYLLSGGWWRKEIQRDYYFAETKSGALFWVYHDGHRRQWFLHGRVA